MFDSKGKWSKHGQRRSEKAEKAIAQSMNTYRNVKAMPYNMLA